MTARPALGASPASSRKSPSQTRHCRPCGSWLPNSRLSNPSKPYLTASLLTSDPLTLCHVGKIEHLSSVAFCTGFAASSNTQ